MKNHYFSLVTDGSNDSGLEKMNPVTVHLFDINRKQVVTEFLDMCLTKGPNAGTADAIFQQIKKLSFECILTLVEKIGLSFSPTEFDKLSEEFTTIDSWMTMTSKKMYGKLQRMKKVTLEWITSRDFFFRKKMVMDLNVLSI